jgi:GH24 family phage-related lysozyme (muramidase)
MIHLHKILTEQDTDFDKERTKDALSKPKDKLNVLFIGDGDTHSQVSYAKDILNSGVVTGNIVSTAEGDITKVLSLLQTNVAGNYDIISLMFSNIVPNNKVSAIEALKIMFNSIEDAGSKLIAISPPTKQFAPYGHVKYASVPEIANWMNTQQISDFTVDAYVLTDNKALFQKNKVLLNKEGHEIIARQWLKYLAEIDPKVDPNILAKKDAEKQQKGAGSEIKLFKQGDKSPKLTILQQRLTSLEYTIDATESKSGTFGESTYQAVRTFQTINEMPVTGYIDENTARAILKPNARAFSKWASMFSSVLPDFMKNMFGTKSAETSGMDFGSIISTTINAFGDYKASYSDDIATQTAAILRKEEGMILTPMWDVNNWRIGHGSSTITKSDGTIITLSNNRAVKPNVTITEEDAERDLKRRLNSEFIPLTKKSLGSASTKYNNATIAALTSVAYNYGRIPKTVIDAAQSGDPKQVANAVGALSANKSRRQREAGWILGSVGATASTSTTSNLTSTNKPLGKSIAIGDSLVPYVATGAGIVPGPKAASTSNPGNNGLWYGGIAIGSLLAFANAYKGVDASVKNVVITIGTNGIFSRSTSVIKQLVSRLHVIFPNAKLLVVKGTYGSKIIWSKPLINVSQKTVDAFYSDFAANGVTVIPTPIGNLSDAHGNYPVYKTIGSEIRSRLS